MFHRYVRPHCCAIIPALVVAWVLLASVARISCGQQTPAEPGAELNFVRVFVPADQLSQVLKGQVDGVSYTTVPILELEELLESRFAKQRAEVIQTPHLSDALYIVRLEDGVLKSELSRWLFEGKSGELNIGDVNFAIQPPASKVQSPPIFYTAGGDIEIRLEEREDENANARWFGFSASPSPLDERQFTLRLPIATQASMLIATPANMGLVSKDVVIEPAGDITKQMPADWPQQATPMEGTDTSWWRVHLAGVSRFTLESVSKEDAEKTNIRHLLQQSEISYLIQQKETLIEASFELAEQPKANLILNAPRAAILTNLTVDGVRVEVASQEVIEDSVRFQLDASQLNRGAVVNINAIVPQTTWDALPYLSIADSFSMNGQTWVRSERALAVTQLRSNSDLDATLINESRRATSDHDRSDLAWLNKWVGEAPQIGVNVLPRNYDWNARTLTSFSADAQWLTARCQARLSSASVETNELRIQLGRGWLVDRVEVSDSSPQQPDVVLEETTSRVRARVVESETGPAELLVSLAEGPTANLELELVLHRRLSVQDGRTMLFADSPSGVQDRIIHMPDADQVDTYVIDPTSNYRALISADLLSYQVPPVALPTWQQKLLPQLSDKWLFQSAGTSLPVLTLASTRPTFSTQVSGVLTSGNGVQAVVDFLLRVQPISGEVRSLVLQFPSDVDPDEWAWELWDPKIAQETVAQELPTRAEAFADRVELSLRLPQSQAATFYVRGISKRLAASSTTTHVNYPLVKDAISGEGLVVAPAVWIKDPPAGMEFLPSVSCCDDPALQSLFPADAKDASFAASLIAGRFDIKQPISIALAVAEKRDSSSWIWEEQIEHWGEGTRQRFHAIRWRMQVGDETSIAVELPKGWQVSGVTVGNQIVPVAAAGRTLAIPVLPNSAQDIELTCTSQGEYRRVAFWKGDEKPRVTLPVVRSSVQVHVPPARVPMLVDSEMLSESAAQRGTLLDRLRPKEWWGWLSPTQPQSMLASRRFDRWSVLPLSPKQMIPVIDRGLLASVALMMGMFFTAISWFMIGKSVLRGWLMLGASCVALILVPVMILPIVQVFALAVAVACVVRICQVVVVGRNVAAANHSKISSSPKGADRSTVTVASLFFCLAALSTGDALGQTGADNTQALVEEEVFGILIPVKDRGADTLEVDGSYAYLREKHYEMLQGDPGGMGTQAATRILSAQYQLRISVAGPGLSSLAPTQELIAEYRVLVGEDLSGLRFPCIEDELAIQRVEINGLPSNGEAIVQEADEIVFRPRMSGSQTIKFYFQPAVELDSRGRTRLLAQIPIVPAANLRVNGAGAGFEVVAMGAKEVVGNDLNVALGPVDELDCSWVLTDAEQALDDTVEAKSHLWVHAQQNEIAASSVLVVNGAQSLPERFHVLVDNDWEPMNREWGDAELVEVQNAALTRLRTYELRLLESARTKASAGQPVYIQALFSPSLSVANKVTFPFMLLQEASQASERSFTWTESPEATWAMERAEAWPAMPASAQLDWTSLPCPVDFGEINERAAVYRMPAGFLGNGLSRRTRPPTTVVEMTRIHMALDRNRLTYEANLTGTQYRNQMRFLAPKNSRVRSLLVDGQPWNYAVLRDAQQDVVVASPVDGTAATASRPAIEPQAGREILLELEFPPCSESKVLQRVLLADVTAESSQVRVFHNLRTKLDLQPALELSNWELPKELVLDPGGQEGPSLVETGMEAAVWDLQDQWRDQSILPIECQIQEQVIAEPIQPVLYVDQVDGEWTATLRARWPYEESFKYLFVDVPSGLESVFDGSEYQRLGSGESGRSVIALKPTLNEGIQTVAVSFPLSLSTLSQSLSLPDIRLLPPLATRPVIALTANLEGVPLEWITNVPPLGTQFQDVILRTQSQDGIQDVGQVDRGTAEFSYFAANEGQTIVSWQKAQQIGASASVRAAHVQLETLSQTTSGGQPKHCVTGWVHFWIEPVGQSLFRVALPEDAEVIGCLLGDQPSVTQSAGSQQDIVVLMRPNYLPCHLRLLVRWSSDSSDLPECGLPEIWTAGDEPVRLIPQSTWIELGSLSDQVVLPSQDGLTRIAPTNLTNEWSQLVAQTLTSLADLQAAELEAWLQSWHPQTMGFDQEAPVTLRPDARTNAPVALTVKDFWAESCSSMNLTEEQVQPLVGSPLASFPLGSRSATQGYPCYQLDDDSSFRLQSREIDSTANTRKYVAAAAVATFSLVFLFAGHFFAFRYMRLMGDQPWLYWLQLAVLLLLLLPIYWPGCFVALISLSLGIGQLWDFRRATQFR